MKKYKVTNKRKTRAQVANPYAYLTNEQLLEGIYPFTVGLDSQRKTQAIEAFKCVWLHLAMLAHKRNTVELTSDNCIKFTLIFPNEQTIMISKPIDCKEFEMQENEVIYSLFENRELIISDVLDIQEFAAKFKHYSKLNDWTK